MSRRWLIAVSVVAHLAVGVGLFVSGVWHMDRLHADPLRTELVLSHEPPAPSGGPVAAVISKINPKEHKHVIKDVVQRVPKPREIKDPEPGPDKSPGPGKGPGDPTASGTCTENCGEAKATAPVCGDGLVDASEQCDDGNTTNGDGCSSTCQIEVAPKPQPTAAVAPNVLQGLRISGETQLLPNTTTQNQMIRDGASRVSGTVKVCLATDGSVASARMAKSTKYDDYDALLLSAVRSWRYQPYRLNGTPVPACSYVTFNYMIQ